MVSLFVKCKLHANAGGKVISSLPVKPRTDKKKKSAFAKRRAKARQQRFREKKAAEQANLSKTTVSAVTVPKEPDSVPKEPEL